MRTLCVQVRLALSIVASKLPALRYKAHCAWIMVTPGIGSQLAPTARVTPRAVCPRSRSPRRKTRENHQPHPAAFLFPIPYSLFYPPTPKKKNPSTRRQPRSKPEAPRHRNPSVPDNHPSIHPEPASPILLRQHSIRALAILRKAKSIPGDIGVYDYLISNRFHLHLGVDSMEKEPED